MSNSIDDKLIDEVAQLWIDNGGDLEGYIYCMERIKDRIQEIQQFNYEQEILEINNEKRDVLGIPFNVLGVW